MRKCSSTLADAQALGDFLRAATLCEQGSGGFG